MPQIEDYIEAPYQGVSQAPQAVRLPTQATAIDDSLVALPDGWQKRPPFTYKASLSASVSWAANTLFDSIELAAGNRTIQLSREASVTALRIYDNADFSEDTVNITTAAQTYLNTGVTDPVNDLRVQTVADTTFIVNRKVQVATVGTTAAARPFEALIWVRASAFGRTYTVTVNKKVSGTPVTATYKTPDGSTSSSTEFIDTAVIADILDDGPAGVIPDNGSASGTLTTLTGQGFTVTRVGSVIYISHPTDDFTVDVEDGQSGTAMIAVKDRIQSFGDLPQRSVNGFTVRVVQSSGTDDDDFFVRYEETEGEGTGVWQETIAPGANLGVDPTTLPVTAQRDPGTGEWNVDTGDWKGRTVGDADLAPDPNFIGEVIEDLSFWKGRLVLLYDEYAMLSSAQDPFAFYPSTLATALDSDPIEKVSPFDKTSTFRYALPFDQKLIIFSDLAQFEITAGGDVSALTTDIDTIGQYRPAQQIAPVGANDKGYFVADRGRKFSTIFELQVDQVTDTDRADDLGIAIPRYIPQGVDRSAVNPTEYLAVYGKSGDNAMYVHVFRYDGAERVQNAYSRWFLPTGWQLGGMYFIGSELHVLAIEPVDGGNNRAHVGICDLTPGLLDEEDTATILTHLDWRVSNEDLVEAYDNVNDRTSVTLPYDVTTDQQLVVRADDVSGPGTGGRPFGGTTLPDVSEGVVADFDSLTGQTARFEGDWTNASYWTGIKYNARCVQSTIYPRGPNGTPTRSNRVSIRRQLFDISRTGYLKVTSQIKGRVPYSITWEGLRYNDADARFDEPPEDTTVLSVPIMAENEQVVVTWNNDSPFGSRVTGFTVIMETNPKARGG